MKKVLILLLTAVSLSSCTDQQIARSFGGTETITLGPGERLVNITWKGKEGNPSLWILTKKGNTSPTTYSFKEKSSLGVMEGEIIIIEK